MKNNSSIFFTFVSAALVCNDANSVSSYMLEIVCKNEPNVVYNRQFWANDDLDAQNKSQALINSNEFKSKGGCTIKNLKRG